jgi:hypothetical protein
VADSGFGFTTREVSVVLITLGIAAAALAGGGGGGDAVSSTPQH